MLLKSIYNSGIECYKCGVRDPCDGSTPLVKVRSPEGRFCKLVAEAHSKNSEYFQSSPLLNHFNVLILINNFDQNIDQSLIICSSEY